MEQIYAYIIKTSLKEMLVLQKNLLLSKDPLVRGHILYITVKPVFKGHLYIPEKVSYMIADVAYLQVLLSPVHNA